MFGLSVIQSDRQQFHDPSMNEFIRRSRLLIADSRVESKLVFKYLPYAPSSARMNEILESHFVCVMKSNMLAICCPYYSCLKSFSFLRNGLRLLWRRRLCQVLREQTSTATFVPGREASSSTSGWLVSCDHSAVRF